jgi:AraC family transcriptional activator of mar-sox-rob regulon
MWELTEMMIPEGLKHGDRDELNVAWGAIALLLARHMHGRHLPRKVPDTRYLSTIQKVYEWIDTHLEHAGTLDEIASRFGLSRSLLTREFRRHTGTSVIDYVNTRRLQKVGIILASTEKSITEAAFESGFSSLANFYRKFKVLYGVTPIEFRKLIENNSSPSAGKTTGS